MIEYFHKEYLIGDIVTRAFGEDAYMPIPIEYFHQEYLTKDIVTRAFGEVTPVDQSLWSTLLGWVGRMAGMMRYDYILILIVIMLMFNGAGHAGGGSAT